MPKLSEKAFTDQYLKNLKPPKSRCDLYDAVQRGLGLRAAPSGTKTWFVMRRDPNGKMRRRTIGKYPEISLADARKQAVNHLMEIANGTKSETRMEISLSEIVDQWLEQDQAVKRTMDQKRQAIDRDVLPVLGSRPLASITKADVRTVLGRIVGRGSPVSANRTHAYMQRLFNWAVENDLVEVSPIAGLKRPSAETSRDRTLTKAELAAVWNAAGDMAYPFGPFFRLLILTGQRRNEVAGMRWREIDLDKGEWIIPADRAKNGKAHLVHLSPEALNLLADISNVDGRDLIFTTNGRTPISGFSKAKAALDTACGVTGWTIHDLRRTFATIATGELGVEPVVVDKILNHSSGAVTGIAAVYQRHAYLDQRKAAVEKWAAHLQSMNSMPS